MSKTAKHSKLYQLAYDCYVVRRTWTREMLTKVYEQGKLTEAEYKEILAARDA